MTTETESLPRISVSGDVIVTRKPDVAYIMLFVRADGILLEDAVGEGTTKVNQIHETLRDKYKEIRDIHIQDVSIGESGPAMGSLRDKTNPPRPEVVKSVLVTIPPSPELAIKIVDTAIRMGCRLGNPAAFPGTPNSQTAILYALADPAEAQHEATVRAIADAKEKAWRIAKMTERRLGRIRGFSATDISNPYDPFRRGLNSVLTDVRYLSVSPEKVQVPGKVSVTFELAE